MNIQAILNALRLGEDKDWEFKSAKGGLPGSLWDTYSAMANTDGGVIVLGVKEKDNGEFEVQGLDDAAKAERDFWNTVNNRGKVSANLLTNKAVHVEQVDSKSVLVIEVPRASRRQRPIFVGQNPLDGTHRRYNDGDYKCNADEVGRMLADQSEQPADSVLLEHYGLADLDERSLREYRNRFSARAPQHPWLKEDEQGFLEKLGGWKLDRSAGQAGLTIAGLLMFGKDEAIRDAVPQYHVDYRERLSSDPQMRWTDRIWPDGTWTANVFQFFERVYPRLVVDLRIPFQFTSQRPGTTTTTTTTAPPEVSFLQRHDETIVHEAIREALVNSVIHADFRGQGGVVIERYRDRLEFSNPGTLLIGIEQVLKGGVSECRNKTLQGMFAMLGYGEKAGSGIDKIRQGWASQKWRWPIIQEQVKPDRVRLILPMVSLLPEESLISLRAKLGEQLGQLSGREVQALVTADVEGSVTNLRLQQFTSDITKMLQDLVAKGLLVKDGYGRWASYRLAERVAAGPDTTAEDSGHKPTSPDIGRAGPDVSPEQDPVLLALTEPARKQKRLDPAEMQRLIRRLCQGRYLTFRQIALLLNREPMGLQRWHLRPMSQEGQLLLLYPDAPNHPKQAYRTNEAFEVQP